MARALTEGLKGNPRQVKRMLNAMLLRTRLAVVARLNIKPDVFSQVDGIGIYHPELFRKLSDWQTVAGGYPPELQKLEQTAANKEKHPDFPKWHKPGVQNWLGMEPLLSGEDLRDYFVPATAPSPLSLLRAWCLPMSMPFTAPSSMAMKARKNPPPIRSGLEAGEIIRSCCCYNNTSRAGQRDTGSEALAMLISTTLKAPNRRSLRPCVKPQSKQCHRVFPVAYKSLRQAAPI